MKTIKKSSVGNCRIKEERDIMILGRKSEWITKLQFAYQDRENLYLVMEYLPGGDLLGLMIRHGAFDEELARFYLAEIALALNALHNLGFVHRDIKPENILLDRFGHLKLADFGSAIALNEDGSFNSITPVGTPDYIAPELLQVLSTKNNQKNQKLDVSCDFWSMGIIGYEMITEKTPFHHDNLYDTYSEIQTYSNSQRLMQVLEFPTDVKMSRQLKDLLNGLITKPNRRMKFDEIQEHSFFRGIEWHNLRDQAPPIIPTLSSEDDTSNFEDIDKSIKRSPVIKKTAFTPLNVNEFSGEDLQFLGYTYIHEETSKFLKHSSSKSHNESRMESKLSNKIEDLQSTIKEQMREIKILQKDLLQAEKKAIQMKSLEKVHDDTKEDYLNIKQELKDKTSEIASLKTEVKMLKSSLKVEEEMRLKHDSSVAEVLSNTYQKWEKAKKISDANFEKIIENKREEINNLTEKIKSNDIELNAKIDECKHLNKVVEKYKDMLKTTKDQHFKDKSKFDENSRKLQTNLDTKIQEHKQKLQVRNLSNLQ
jgi:citron Rho-interacting kinase